MHCFKFISYKIIKVDFFTSGIYTAVFRDGGGYNPNIISWYVTVFWQYDKVQKKIVIHLAA